MSRRRVILAPWLLGLALISPAFAQAQQSPPKDESAQISPDQLPPDEDAAAKAKEQFAFNPLQSNKDVIVGDEYFKKGNFRAAAARYIDATKWNEGNAQAWLRLGDAQEKMKDAKAARDAWQKYLQLAPEAKNAAEVKKKIEKLKS